MKGSFSENPIVEINGMVVKSGFGETGRLFCAFSALGVRLSIPCGSIMEAILRADNRIYSNQIDDCLEYYEVLKERQAGAARLANDYLREVGRGDNFNWITGMLNGLPRAEAPKVEKEAPL